MTSPSLLVEHVLSVEFRLLTEAETSYPLGAKIGHGWFGTVYRCLPCGAEHDVAVKTLHCYNNVRDHTQIEFLKAFSRGDTYVGVPRLFDLYEADGKQHIVMQLFEGTRLCNASSNHDRIMMILFKVVAIFNWIHKQNYLHLDLKSDNILYNDENDVMLIDCGGVKMKNGRNFTRTSDDFYWGVHYGAPEIGRGKCGYATDIYSLGVMCKELMNEGGKPYDQRLVLFCDKTIQEDEEQRPTASQLLNDDLFKIERDLLGITNNDELDSEETFLKIIKLNDQRNVINFGSYPVPGSH